MVKLKYKIGDIVEIGANYCDHLFLVGEKVEILTVNEEDKDYFAVSTENDSERWFIVEEDIKDEEEGKQ